MIPYSRESKDTIPASSVMITGLGGAGTNMLERIALNGVDGADLAALNTDVRTLGSSMAGVKIQLGLNLTKGLGTGGDPDLGRQAVLEAEEEVRASLKGRRIVFLCVGLGGGTGSGAASIVTRIAREEGAFVVVFATMPFAFEGKRRREQAETALNELAVLSNALVTFDNNRMGELVLAKQGIHDAFIAADRMISESIKAVIRLVVKPGLINVGLDDLMSALRTNRSRCLFGSGMANGKDRAAKALRNALSSPLLDQGALLKDAQTVLVHLCGGQDLTLFEIELLMQRLMKFVPENAHVLFGAAVDPTMGDDLSITLISALPEDALSGAPRLSAAQPAKPETLLEIEPGSPGNITPEAPTPATEQPTSDIPKARQAAPDEEPVDDGDSAPSPLASRFRRSLGTPAASTPSLFDSPPSPAASASVSESPATVPELPLDERKPATKPFHHDEEDELVVYDESPSADVKPVAVAEFVSARESAPAYGEGEPDPAPIEQVIDLTEEEKLNQPVFNPIPRKRPSGAAPWSGGQKDKPLTPDAESTPETPGTGTAPETPKADDQPEAAAPAASTAEQSAPAEALKLKLGIKSGPTQNELSFDSTPRGRFEGGGPNLIDGEDLDLPPFLRKKK